MKASKEEKKGNASPPVKEGILSKINKKKMVKIMHEASMISHGDGDASGTREQTSNLLMSSTR